MTKPKILIIGCGAVGLSQGYHLSTGADITYLVRPGRKPAFAAPKYLYDYKANALRVFENYRLIDSVREVAGEEFYCVFDTLDGHTARSEAGTATLRSVGDLIRDNLKTFVVYDAIGLGIADHYATSLGISPNRLVLAFSMLAHQPTNTISIPATANRDLAAKADLFYSHQPGEVGLLVFNNQPKLLKALKEVYEKNNVLHVQSLPAFMIELAPMLAMLQVVTWNIDGYKEFEYLYNNAQLWPLLLEAQKEILRLPRFGWTGWVLSWLLGSWATAKMAASPIEGALPLSYHEFNAFHHGGKVVKQDIRMLEDVVIEGEKAGHKMKSLREICRLATETENKKAKARASEIK
ncbi:ketopantoate reductase ApbA/PanE domain-containing protein [Pyrenochaeta sp. MPI-SDFR-AT-0127]|nr:ketopantoate reductase ApbA/PanE domain-containing protein [Pyrenochaeta sp. MPI-SDFR-AT-0127]